MPALRKRMLPRHGPDNNTTPERRAMRRFSIRLPASVRVSGIPAPFKTESQKVSGRGIFFYIDRWMKVGSHVEVNLDFASQLTMADPVRVRFVARVVRVQSQTGMQMGVAAAIEQYEFFRLEEKGAAELQPGWSLGS